MIISGCVSSNKHWMPWLDSKNLRWEKPRFVGLGIKANVWQFLSIYQESRWTDFNLNPWKWKMIPEKIRQVVLLSCVVLNSRHDSYCHNPSPSPVNPVNPQSSKVLSHSILKFKVLHSTGLWLFNQGIHYHHQSLVNHKGIFIHQK